MNISAIAASKLPDFESTFTRVTIGKLHIATALYDLVNQEILPNTGIAAEYFWQGFESIVQDLAPKNRALLAERERLQAELNQWHTNNPNIIEGDIAIKQYQAFLEKIAYLVPEPSDFSITTTHVDSELAQQAGPQLVVPILNARYALNAANARWGSLYDALYGTDVIDDTHGCEKITADGKVYNPVRGAKVIAYGRSVLDRYLPLNQGASHTHATAYSIVNGVLHVLLNTGEIATLRHTEQCVGYQGNANTPSKIILLHHGLHLEIVIDRTTIIGASDAAGISDIILEAALSTILDLEDSVAVVDADDKVLAYRNWLGITQGHLTETLEKKGVQITRGLNTDRFYTSIDGTLNGLRLQGRSLMFLRNVGHLMTHPAILYESQQPINESNNILNIPSTRLCEIPEGIMDAVITTAIALHDLAKPTDNLLRNSRTGSIYIVKPKMHGPTEVAFACELFSRVEALLGLKHATVKLGIMDEERRTSVNLKACIAAASERVAFINTGFLDRTGDEIHTSMFAGVMLRKADMKHSTWLNNYELNNVIVGLACGLKGKAQIGKGMWAMPDLMANMLKQKITHVQSGANTAWVPSPTAATLHALHYHDVDVSNCQTQLQTQLQQHTQQHTVDIPQTNFKMDRHSLLTGLLTIPIASPSEQSQWRDIDKQRELDNNVQSILGYVVRWIDQGIGCSKVPDISGIYLMEDRATLRISSQHIANWLHHGVLTEHQVLDSFKRMAAIVDTQNVDDILYTPLILNINTNQYSMAYYAALELVLQGKYQPSGYTEPILHAWRLRVKILQSNQVQHTS